MSENQEFISRLIEEEIEDVAEALKDFNMTKLSNIKKVIEMEYTRLELMKNKLIETREEEDDPIRVNVIKEVISDIYVALQRLEDIATIIEELKSQKKIDF